MATIINGENVPNMAWEECPEGYRLPIWRYSQNPITKRNPCEGVNRIFNSALVPFNGEFIGVFRCDQTNGQLHLYVGHSKDGYNIELEKEKIHFLDQNGNPIPDTLWGYDPRVIKIEDEYYVVWCDEVGCGPSLGIARTKDFKKFYKYDNPFLPSNRNGVLFPRKINGQYVMISRPSDIGHTPFGDIYLSFSKDLEFWGKHRLLQAKGFASWCMLKIGGGPAPIETDEGWLMFMHGVTLTCSGYVYCAGAMLLDRDDPTKILYRSEDYLLEPCEDYEVSGFVPNVVFPTAVVADQATGRLAIYYGCADTYTSVAFTTVDRVIDFIKKHDNYNKK